MPLLFPSYPVQAKPVTATALHNTSINLIYGQSINSKFNYCKVTLSHKEGGGRGKSSTKDPVVATRTTSLPYNHLTHHDDDLSLSTVDQDKSPSTIRFIILTIAPNHDSQSPPPTMTLTQSPGERGLPTCI